MAVHKVPLKFYTGSTHDQTWTWKVGNTAATATPVDLTGCTARAQFRPKIGSPTVLLDLSTQNGGIQLGGVLGTIRVLVTDEQTAQMTWTTAVYDLFIYFPDGSAVARMAGTATVTQGVTSV